MIIYNKLWLKNLGVQQQAEDVYHEGCITEIEIKAIKDKYPVSFYRPGIIIRIGLFLLTCIIILFSAGLLTLILFSSHIVDDFGWPLLLGLMVYVVLEVMTKRKHYYRSGVDDALLYAAAGLITGSFVWFISDLDKAGGPPDGFSISIFVFILGLYLTLRFADMLTSLLTTLSFLFAVFFMWKKLGGFGLTTLPFVMMAICAVIYVIVRRLYHNSKVPWYYTHCLMAAEVVSLVMFYTAGNYYVVQSIGNQLDGNAVSGTSLPFGFFFWLCTMLLPFAYTIRGLLKKDAMLLRIGILLVAGAVFTFRHYYHHLSPEIVLTLAGVILLALVYAAIRYLRNPKHGVTYDEKSKAGYLDNIKIESLLIGGTFGRHDVSTPGQSERFGGGDFGGGGSEGTY